MHSAHRWSHQMTLDDALLARAEQLCGPLVQA